MRKRLSGGFEQHLVKSWEKEDAEVADQNRASHIFPNNHKEVGRNYSEKKLVRRLLRILCWIIFFVLGFYCGKL